MTESLEELRKLHKGFTFWVRNFYGFILLGPISLGIDLGITKNISAEPPCHIHVKVHSPWAFHIKTG